MRAASLAVLVGAGLAVLAAACSGTSGRLLTSKELENPVVSPMGAPTFEILAMAPAVLAEGRHDGEGFRYYIEDSDLKGIVKIMTGNTDPENIAKFRYGSGMVVHMPLGKGEVVTAATCEWVMGLKRNCAFTQQITRNILDRFTGA